MLGNPITFVDPTGMKVEYADNVSGEVRDKIDELIRTSKSFAALFNYLNTLTDEEGNAIIFLVTGGAPRRGSQGTLNTGEATMELGGEVFLSDEIKNIGISEEFFHKFQISFYGLNKTGTVNGRRSFELEAEAKFFNSILVSEGVIDDRTIIPQYEQPLRNKLFVEELRENENSIIVQKLGRSSNPSRRGNGENYLSFSYRLYLQDFQKGNMFNPAYRGTQRALTPAASNAVQKQ